MLIHRKSILYFLFFATALASPGTAVVAAPSFDCNRANTATEKMICANPKLADLDSELDQAYKIALRDAPWDSANKRIRREQKQWITMRDKCDTVMCMRHVYHKRIGALYAEVSGFQSDQQSTNADPANMMSVCSERAANIFHIRLPNIETKYEGQRTDGTYAINGTAYLRNNEETFQCSFSKDGISIVQFIVN